MSLAISRDGRFVAFCSYAIDLIPGFVDLNGSTFNPNEVANEIAAKRLAASVASYQLNSAPGVGTIGNTHFLAIAFNASAREAAQVLANFLLSPQAQARKADIAVWGDPTVLALDKLSAGERELFTGSAAPGQVRQPMPAVPEPHGSWVDPLEREWLRRYGQLASALQTTAGRCIGLRAQPHHHFDATLQRDFGACAAAGNPAQAHRLAVGPEQDRARPLVGRLAQFDRGPGIAIGALFGTGHLDPRDLGQRELLRGGSAEPKRQPGRSASAELRARQHDLVARAALRADGLRLHRANPGDAVTLTGHGRATTWHGSQRHQKDGQGPNHGQAKGPRGSPTSSPG